MICKIVQEKLSIEHLIEVDFKKIKSVEEVFVQFLLQETSKKDINEMVELFLNMKS